MVTVDLRSLVGKLNDACRRTLEAAAGLCVARTHYDVEIEHWLLKLCEAADGDIPRVLRHYDVDLTQVTQDLSRVLDRLKTGNTRTPSLSREMPKVIRDAWVLASVQHQLPTVRSALILLALLDDADTVRRLYEESRALRSITADSLRTDLMQIVAGSAEDDPKPPRSGARTSPPSIERRDRVRVFLSYRRDDTRLLAESLFDRLMAGGGVEVFRDIDTVAPGALIKDSIDEAITSCDAMIALIGKNWAGKPDASGAPRIDAENDWVRLEIAAALRQGKTVVPCLVAGAKLPRPEDLPSDIRGLCDRNTVTISRRTLRRDAQPLIDWLEKLRDDRHQ